jgi:multidrug efflux system outer membrane protein
MIKKLFFIYICIGLLLCGCSFAPKYTQPKIPIPDTWPDGAAYENINNIPGTSISDLTWENFFIEKSLQTIIRTALLNNRDLKLAALNVERARDLYGIQRAELYPTFNAIGEASKKRVPANVSGTSSVSKRVQYDFNLEIASWEIDFFGHIRSLKDQALETYLATEQARLSAQISLIAEVVMAYLTFAADRENLKLAQATLKNQQESYDLIKKSYQIGLATELDVRRAQTLVDIARRDIPRFVQQVAQDQNALNLLAGTQVTEKLLPRDLSNITPFKEIETELSSNVLLTRPDILAAEHRLKAAYANIGAVRAAFLPRITLTGALGTASTEMNRLFKPGSGAWNFSPQITIPIFDARSWAALRVSKAERKIMLTQYEKTIQIAFREVSDVLSIKGTINKQIEAQMSLVDSVKETYRLSKKRYEMGLESYLGVLDAQRSLYGQQQILISFQLAKLANQVKLYAVLGGGGTFEK